MKLAGIASLLALVASVSVTHADMEIIRPPSLETVTVYETVTVQQPCSSGRPLLPLSSFGKSELASQPPAPASSITDVATADKDGDKELGVTTQTHEGTPAPEPTKPAGNAADWVTQMLCQVNQVRAQNGVRPLALSPALIQAAQQQSDYQNSIGQMTHDNPAGGLGSRLSALGVSWTTAAENVAAGMSTPNDAQNAWVKSPGHFMNMISASMGYFGAARANNYFTQCFYGNGTPPNATEIPAC